MDVELVDFVDNVDEGEALIGVRIPRHVYLRSHYFEQFSEKDFFRRFRLQKQTVLNVLQRIELHLEYPHDRNNSLSPINQLLLTLRAFATGSHLVTIGDFIHCDKSTVSKIVAKVSRLLAVQVNEYIYMPRNAVEIAEEQNKFYELAQFPRVVGAIDGCHIRIQSQGGPDAEIFRNRKGYFSINVQAVASADLLFKDLVARWPGSSHDSTMFNNSRLKHQFTTGRFGNSLLLGDSGYMNLPYLFTPFLEPRNEGERNYNTSHIRTRVTVEHLFGVWKRRFPIVAYGCRMKLENILAVIVATAVLHNIAQLNGDPEPPIEDEVMEHELQQAILDGDIPIAVDQHIHFDHRRHLVDTYFARQ